MKKSLAVFAVAALSASQAFGAVNLIQPDYSGTVIISTSIGRSHGGAATRFLPFLAANPAGTTAAAPSAINGTHHLEDTVLGGASALAGDGGDMGDFFAVFTVDDIQGNLGSVLDIPAGTRIAGLFYGTKDSFVTDADNGGSGDTQVILESTGGRMEFYLVPTGGNVFSPGLSGASFDASGKLTYAGINDAGQTELMAYNFTKGDLTTGDLPLSGLAAVNASTTELRALNTDLSKVAFNNGAFYARIDKGFGDITLANRFDNGGFGASTLADFAGDYTMNPLNLGTPGSSIPANGANSFSLFFNDPIIGSVTAIPEPSTILLLGTGLVGLVAYRRHKIA